MKGKRSHSILLHLVILISIYLFALMLFLGIRFSFESKIKKNEFLKDNQKTKIHMIQDVKIDLYKIENYFFSVTSNYPLDNKCENKSKIFSNIKEIINFLNNGGVRVHKYELNFKDFPEYLEKYELVVDDLAKSSIEINEFSRKLLSLEKIVKKNKNIIYKREDSRKEFKSIRSLFLILHKDLNHIYYGTVVELNRINLLIVKTSRKYKFIGTILFSVISILIFVLSLFIYLRIKLIQNELKESKNCFQVFSDVSLDAIFFIENGICIEANARASELSGYSYDELIGKSLLFIVAPESKKSVTKKMFSGFDKPYDAVIIKKNGLNFSAEIHGRAYEYKNKKIRITIARDITERKKYEDRLKDYSKTQEILLKEVNHRVKNNLYAISGLITKEKNKIQLLENSFLLEFINDLANRIGNLSTVHSLLSASKWQSINLSVLCEDIAKYLLCDMIRDNLVTLTVVKIEIEVNSFHAQQIALVINEIITNIIKYCVTEDEKIVVNIGITYDENQIYINVEDNGKGFPKKILEANFVDIGIGFDLIFGIVKKSLGGSVELENGDGAIVHIAFKRMELDNYYE